MTEQTTQPQPRVYSLDQHGLTQEQVAVTFAMTSRSPDPFDEIAGRVREADSAAQFHERWVLGYGHASVAEHAVLHLAVENISRLACDTLEDNRLASYTEKSSRYQVIDRDQYHHPSELDDHPDLSTTYHQACRTLFDAYHHALEDSIAYLQRQEPNRKKETGSARALRIRRVATDNCRALLPAATLTNVGVTANARTLEHAISKLMSSPRREEQDLGSLLLRAGLAQTPTLIRHASPNQYLQRTREARERRDPLPDQPDQEEPSPPPTPGANVIQHNIRAEALMAEFLLYRRSNRSFEEVRRQVARMTPRQIRRTVQECLELLGDHDAPIREFENITYLVEFVMDYGAYREFKRHRMQTSLSQEPGLETGYSVPPLMTEAGIEDQFHLAIAQAEETYRQLARQTPRAAPYILTHAHHRRVLTTLNLRQCYHLFKLRTSPQAHHSIRIPMQEALDQIRLLHPALFQHIRLRK